ncbi:uncharacterized protein [Ptychodera flava]|uniref:uncharacterized protein n=1 Tax=Ptychodera flava TaxID=63121 RepID=UPI00396A7451
MDNEVSVSAISLHNEIAPMAGNAHRSGRHSLSKDAGDRGSTAAGPDSGNRTWKSQVQGFGNRTTTHGISYIVNASSHFSRTIWLVIFLAAMAALVAQVGLLIKQYFDRDVIVEIKLVTDEQLPFPTVTVCNTNMIRRSAVKDTVHRELLVFDSDLVRPYYVPCYDGDFQCAGGQHCIKPFNQCDGTIHCPDNSDEQNCTYGFCGEEQFRCRSGSECHCQISLRDSTRILLRKTTPLLRRADSRGQSFKKSIGDNAL